MAMSVQYMYMYICFCKYLYQEHWDEIPQGIKLIYGYIRGQFMLRGRKEWRRLKVIFHLKLIVPKSKARLRESLKNVPIKIIFVKLQFSNTWVFHRTVGFNNIFFNFFWVCVFGILILSLSGHQHFHWHDKPVQYTIL
jgi:hypothetical protein